MTNHLEVELLWQLETFIRGLTHYHKNGTEFIQLQPVLLQIELLKNMHYDQQCEECLD